RADSPAYGCGQRPLDRYAKIPNRLDRVVRQPLFVCVECLLSRENLKPRNFLLSAVRLLDGRVKYSPRRFPDIAARPISLNERNHWRIGHLQFAVGISDCAPFGWHG